MLGINDDKPREPITGEYAEKLRKELLISKALKIWKGPFWTDNYGWIYSSENVPAFTFECPESEEEDREFIGMARNIVKILNGEEGVKYSNLSIQDGCDLYMGDRLLGSFRGWGHLTGNGCHLSSEEAAKVQDAFIEYCMEKIKEDV